jgi:hypothetical protein
MNEIRSKKFNEYMQFLSDIKDSGGNYQVDEGPNGAVWWVDYIITLDSMLMFNMFCNGKYRIKPKIKRVPLDQADIKHTTVFRLREDQDNTYSALRIGPSWIGIFSYDSVSVEHVYYSALMRDGWEYSSDNGETWQDCSKEANDE